MAKRNVPNPSQRGEAEFPYGANAPDAQENNRDPGEVPAVGKASSPGPEPGDRGNAHEGNGEGEGTDPATSANGTTAGPDPFDVEALRLPQGPGAAIGVKRLLLNVPHRKPDKSWFVRTHTAEEYRIVVGVLELKEDREIYLVAPALRAELETEPTYRRKLLVTAVNRQGLVFLWETTLPEEGGRKDNWGRSALEALDLASRRWIRVVANLVGGAYDVYEAAASLADPEWPTVPLGELLRLSFKDHYIDSMDHPTLRKLRGEV
jgi:hypothetical protein